MISRLETTETQEHSNSTLFYHAAISVMPRETLKVKHTARGSAHASEPKSRRKVHVENVHEVELPKDPVIVVGGGELVARELAAREHHPAAETTAAPSRTILVDFIATVAYLHIEQCGCALAQRCPGRSSCSRPNAMVRCGRTADERVVE